MKKVALVSLFTPYRENVRGISALAYHLMAKRDADIDIVIYSFNINRLSAEQIAEVEHALNVKIHLLPIPKWYDWIMRFPYLAMAIRVLMRYPMLYYVKLPQLVVDEIGKLNPDGVWIYGEEMMQVSRQLGKYRRVHTFPDSEALYYKRMLGTRFVRKSKSLWLRNAIMRGKYHRMECRADSSALVRYHLVGDADVKNFQEENPQVQAYFLRHPHYELGKENVIGFPKPHIRLLLAGQCNYYMKQDADALIDVLSDKENAEKLKDMYQFTFLGKGWEQQMAQMRDAGWQVCHIPFADDYIAEVCSHDVQITPISIGTGTKGKVLDAIANGLLVIGTEYALENVAVCPGRECLQYQSADDVVAMLGDIATNRERYEQMAERGREAVLKYHDRTEASRRFFSLFD